MAFSHYFVGLGSNVEPEANIAKAIEHMATLTDRVEVSRIISTTPVNLPTSNNFLNAVVCIAARGGAVGLKEKLNQIEVRLGRDREDPDRAKKDRTIDLDILLSVPADSRVVDPADIPQEWYHRGPLLELLNVLGFTCPVPPMRLTGATEVSSAAGFAGLTPFCLEVVGRPPGLRLTRRRAALVTGGAVRLGRAIAGSLAKLGYDIALHYNKSEPAAQDAADEFRSYGVRCGLFRYDLTELSGISGFVANVRQHLPHLCVLVNSASLYDAGSIMDTTVEMVGRQFTVNFQAPLFLMKGFRESVEHGSIVNILDNKIAYNQYQYVAYLASKKALADLTKMAALEFAPNIRVNGIAPGVVLPASERSKTYLEWRRSAIPVNKLGSPDNVCDAIAAVLDNLFINGQIIFVDGGEAMNVVGRHARDFGPGSDSPPAPGIEII